LPNFFSLLDVRYKIFRFYGDEVLRAINFNFFSHKKYDPYQTISSNNNNNNEKFHTYLSELMWKLLIRKIAPFLLSEGACDTSKCLPLLFQLALCQLINYNFALNFYGFLLAPCYYYYNYFNSYFFGPIAHFSLCSFFLLLL